MDVYDKIKSVSAAEGWTESTEVRLLCEYIEALWRRLYGEPSQWDFDYADALVKFLQSKQEAS